MQSPVDARTLSKLRWRCRRGLLENDLLIERFFERRAPHLSGADLAALDELLDYSDNDLWDVITGRSERFDARLAAVVSQLRAT